MPTVRLEDAIDFDQAEMLLIQHDHYDVANGNDIYVTVGRVNKGRWAVFVQAKNHACYEKPGSEPVDFWNIAAALEVALSPRNHEKWGLHR